MLKSLLTFVKAGTCICIWVATIVVCPGSFAQSRKIPLEIGSTTSFIRQLSTSEANSRKPLLIQTAESTLPLVINVKTDQAIRGEINGIAASNVFFDFSASQLDGKIILPLEKKAYHYYSNAKGQVVVESIDINNVVCINMYTAPMEPAAESQLSKTSIDIPQLQSLPGETAVVYLDFDGHTVSGGKWNGGKTIAAEPADLTESQMSNAWFVISEDYRAYRLNVTTIESVYNAAPKNKRMRCIITPTTTAAPGSGGVAYIGSFDAGDPDNTPCWVFNLGGTGQTTGETCSHEIGHTMGLSHDGKVSGTEYYTGHANWSPIMGSSYNKTITHWSKGEYTGATQQQDDVNIIGTQNGFTWRSDETGRTPATASPLKVEIENGLVLASRNYGIITIANDVDAYAFKTGAGTVTFTVKPAANFPNLDVSLTITDASGTVLETANPSATLSASITATLPAGTFYLSVDGAGTGNPLTGYSDYSSLGEYTIEGKVIIAPTAIREIVEEQLSIYPNPAADLINVQFTNTGMHTIQIFNVLGQALQTLRTDEPLVVVNLTSYNKGIYFITVETEGGTSTSKFIRE